MHRAGILTAGRWRLGFDRPRSKVFDGIGVEFRGATLAAEIISLALVSLHAGRRFRIYVHPANGIFERDYFGRGLPDLNQARSIDLNRLGREIFRRLGAELSRAALAAEIMRLPGVRFASGGGVGLDIHSAYRIFHELVG